LTSCGATATGPPFYYEIPSQTAYRYNWSADWRAEPINAEDRQLDLLARFHIAADNQTIRRVPSFDYGAATLAGSARQFAVNPDLSIIID
jgi:hypothetical protein